MKKRAKVIMLPTDKASQVGVCKYGERKGLFYGSEPSIEENLQNQYLYITTDDEIKEGDWFYDSLTPNVYKAGETPVTMKCFKKIIATTDPELKVLNKYSSEEGIMELLPQIPQSFIEEYCRVGGIDEIDVEYFYRGLMCPNCGNDEFNCEQTKDCTVLVDYGYEPKIRNNKIIIHLIEEKMYSESELIQFVLDNRFKIDSDTTREPILNELFPPEFRVGDKVVVESGGLGALCADGVVGEIISKPKEKPVYYNGELWKVDAKVYVESFNGICYGLCDGYKLRHATPEEIAAAEWEPMNYKEAYNRKHMKCQYVLKYRSGGYVVYKEDIDGNWVKCYYDRNDCLAYTIHSNGCWEKRRYDSNKNLTYVENSDKYWEIREYDAYMNETYREHSFGYWWRRNWDSQNRFISYESHTGEWYRYHYDDNGDAYKEYPTSNGKAMKIDSETYHPIWKEVSSFK